MCWIYFLLEAIRTYCSPTKVVAWGQWSAALLTTLPFLISYGCSNNTVRLLCCRMLFCAIFPLNGTNLITINQFEKKITALAESSERDLVALGPISAHFYGHPMRAMYTKKRRKVILSREEHESSSERPELEFFELNWTGHRPENQPDSWTGHLNRTVYYTK